MKLTTDGEDNSISMPYRLLLQAVVLGHGAVANPADTI
jgi:hypothetical protein